MVLKKYIILLLVIISGVLSETLSPSLYAQERKLNKIERKADRNFVRQRFSRAMNQYERALRKETKPLNIAALQLKIARLYFMVREYEQATNFYSLALESNPNLPSVDDICNYIDGLRFIGQNKRAEAVSLDNAYKDIYTNNQRFKNTLDALSMRHSVHDNPAYSIHKLALNSNNSEFWVGNYGGDLFYGLSYSKFNDSGKMFFHKTKYYSLQEFDGFESANEQKQPKYFQYMKEIPVDMQNGPVTFSPGLDMMVGTVIEYDKKERTVEMIDKETRPFRTKLYYSTLSFKNKRFKKYTPIFDQDNEYSYAHPYLFNNGKSLLFSSDMPGGYGGFDLYVCHWDEVNSKWGQPVNLGPVVNTEGNEIYPVVYENRLVFSSNGLPGFGGYDLFTALLDAYGVIPGSVNHLPAPVNSVFNDYFMLPVDLKTSYIVSDRDSLTVDDIYYVRMSYDIGSQNGMPYYGMVESDAILGGGLLLNEQIESSDLVLVNLKPLAPEGLLLSLYFDFDSNRLTPESLMLLQKFIEEMNNYQFNSLILDGYADEIGNSNYNLNLSERRANAVASYLKRLGVNCKLDVRPHGVIKLDKQDLEKELGKFYQLEKDIDWIKLNWKSRRVDIYNKR